LTASLGVVKHQRAQTPHLMSLFVVNVQLIHVRVATAAFS